MRFLGILISQRVGKFIWQLILVLHLLAGFYYFWHTQAFSHWCEQEKCRRALAVGYQFLESRTEAGRFVHHYAYEETMQGLIRSVVDDRYAAFYPERDEQILLHNLGGYQLNFGFKIQQTEAGTVISFVEKKGPAAKSGVKCGDLILSVDGQVAENVALLLEKAKQQQRVCLELQRNNEQLSVVIEAQFLKQSSLSFEFVDERILYVSLQDFSASSAEDLVSFLQQNKSQIDGIILDLRGNSGGLMTEAIEVASVFLSKNQLITKICFFNGIRKNLDALSINYKCEKPLVVLIDKQTASAAELTAAALQAHQRAMLVGEKSYGKGSVQELCQLPYGGLLKVTTALYETPNGVCFNQIGVMPNVVCPLSKEAAQQIENSKKNGVVLAKDILEFDCQLGKAIKLIQSEIYKK